MVDIITNLAGRVSNLEEQRSLIGDVIDRAKIFFESVGVPVSTCFRLFEKNCEESITVVDAGVTLDYTIDHSEFLGIVPMFRFDYGRLDYDRLSFKGGTTNCFLTSVVLPVCVSEVSNYNNGVYV